MMEFYSFGLQSFRIFDNSDLVWIQYLQCLYLSEIQEDAFNLWSRSNQTLGAVCFGEGCY